MRSLPTIMTRRHYFDAVSVWTERNSTDRQRLAPHCRKLHVSRANRCGPQGLDARIQLYQPTDHALEALREIAEARLLIINRIEVALDFIMASPTEATTAYDYLDAHLIQRWHGSDAVAYVKGTRYTRPRRWTSRQLVMYADSRAAGKNDGNPTCHLELRASAKRQVDSLDLASPAKLLALDHDEFWRRFLILEEPAPRMIGRQARGRSRAKKPDLRTSKNGRTKFDADVRAGNLVVRTAASSERGATAQDVRDYLRDAPWFRPATAMRRIDPEPFVPAVGTPLMMVQPSTFPSHTAVDARIRNNRKQQKDKSND